MQKLKRFYRARTAPRGFGPRVGDSETDPLRASSAPEGDGMTKARPPGDDEEDSARGQKAAPPQEEGGDRPILCKGFTKEAEELLARMDADGDHGVSKSEFNDALEAGVLDLHGDGRDARSATKIQARYRSYLVRREIDRDARSATKIQARYRSYLVRREIDREARSATKIQARYRGYSVRKTRSDDDMSGRHRSWTEDAQALLVELPVDADGRVSKEEFIKRFGDCTFDLVEESVRAIKTGEGENRREFKTGYSNQTLFVRTQEVEGSRKATGLAQATNNSRMSTESARGRGYTDEMNMYTKAFDVDCDHFSRVDMTKSESRERMWDLVVALEQMHSEPKGVALDEEDGGAVEAKKTSEGIQIHFGKLLDCLELGQDGKIDKAELKRALKSGVLKVDTSKVKQQLAREEQEKAAAKIQARYRGYQVRKVRPETEGEGEDVQKATVPQDHEGEGEEMGRRPTLERRKPFVPQARRPPRAWVAQTNAMGVR